MSNLIGEKRKGEKKKKRKQNWESERFKIMKSE